MEPTQDLRAREWVTESGFKPSPAPNMLKGFPGGSVGKESACNIGDLGLISGPGRSPGEGNGKPAPVFLPEEFHGQRSLASYLVHGVTKSQTWLTDFQARIREWVAISFSRASSWPQDRTCISSTGRWILYHWATWEALDFHFTSLC